MDDEAVQPGEQRLTRRNERPDGRVHALSKGIGVNADGTCASVTYEDVVVRVDQGWRISRRKVLARRVPLKR
ncbi:hypothetical protein GCM10022224_010230 [Nonomuraea antimicrobica]|uniref:SnoaL-like domain-containing protein n=1 Tax=Nonomuraea antimicrobica TaxID=561173 RepID=A0ABP7B644_9ACTN